MLHVDRANSASTSNAQGENKRVTQPLNNNNQNSVNVCASGPNEESDNFAISATSCNLPHSPNLVILSTAVVYIKNSDNKFVKCRALLDSVSQMNFISRDLTERLKLNKTEINVPVYGVS